MRWDFGDVYKKIRESKGLTQQEVCGGVISRTSLAKIEANQRIPSFENMIFLLNQIDMTLEEFHYICHYYKPSKRQEIINTVKHKVILTETKELEAIKKLCQDYLAIHHDIPIQHINERLTIFLEMRKNGPQSKDKEFHETVKTIWTYLEKEDNWYFSDLQLLNAILFHFPTDSLPIITDRLLNSLKKYKDYTTTKPIELVILTNLATIYLHNNLEKECEKITKLTLELAKNLKRYDSLALSQVRLGICRKDDELIHKGMELLRLTEETDLIQTLEEEIKNFR